MRMMFVALVVTSMAAPTWAQTTPPPLPGTSSDGGSLQSLGRAVFSAVEKAAIEKFFGRSATPTEQILIDAAKDAVLGGNATAGSERGGYDTPSQMVQGDDTAATAKTWENTSAGKGKGKGKGRNKGMPPGLAKKQQLPPGLQRRVAKHGSLPPGLAKRDLPDDLERELPPPQAGTRSRGCAVLGRLRPLASNFRRNSSS